MECAFGVSAAGGHAASSSPAVGFPSYVISYCGCFFIFRRISGQNSLITNVIVS
jgi:hypothetical protein